MLSVSIAENVALVRARMEQAARAAGRDPAAIRLLAATKMNDADRVRQAVAAGVDICGENRVQEMLEKNAQGAYAGAPLHFIGHLQKNKVRQVVGLCALIHSVDSLPLLQEISKTAEKRGLTQDVLLEVNIGSEELKSGFSPEEIGPALEEAVSLIKQATRRYAKRQLTWFRRREDALRLEADRMTTEEMAGRVLEAFGQEESV